MVRGTSGNQTSPDQLWSDNEDLQKANSSLQSQVSTTQEQNKCLVAQVNTARQELSYERTKNEEQRERMASLRQMLVPATEDQVSDTEIMQRFTALRSLVFRLVKGTWSMKFKDKLRDSDVSDNQHSFFAPFVGGDPKWKTLHNHLRHFIFNHLCLSALDRRRYFLHENCKWLDEQLETTETNMWDSLPKGNTAPIVSLSVLLSIWGILMIWQKAMARLWNGRLPR